MSCGLDFLNKSFSAYETVLVSTIIEIFPEGISDVVGILPVKF